MTEAPGTGQWAPGFASVFLQLLTKDWGETDFPLSVFPKKKEGGFKVITVAKLWFQDQLKKQTSNVKYNENRITHRKQSNDFVERLAPKGAGFSLGWRWRSPFPPKMTRMLTYVLPFKSNCMIVNSYTLIELLLHQAFDAWSVNGVLFLSDFPTHWFCGFTIFFPQILFQAPINKDQYICDVYCYYIQFRFLVLGVAKLPSLPVYPPLCTRNILTTAASFTMTFHTDSWPSEDKTYSHWWSPNSLATKIILKLQCSALFSANYQR